MENKKLNYVLVCLPIAIFALFVGIYVGQRQSAISTNTTSSNGFLSEPLSKVANSEDFATFWKVWQILDQKYVSAGSTTEQTKVYGAIQGLAQSYGDPYTVFFPPVESKLFNDDIKGDFGGVGMEIGIKDKQLVVVAPLKGSPAEAVGVKAGDAIIAIDGTSTASLSSDQAVKVIRGPKGTVVKITFVPVGGTKQVVRSITRDTINIPTIDTSTKPGGIFVISLYSFTAQSANLFRNALRSFVISGDHKLVLDLRGNPGGYLDAAVDMASWFLPAGKVVVTEDFGKNASSNVFRSNGNNIFNKNLDMLVLVDGGSASAAEILAGALKEQGVAKLVGTKTFGKGSVQELIPITSDTSLKVTIARWLTPNGHNLSHDGLDPDYLVPLSDSATSTIKDVQMQKAVDLLSAQP